nr:MAG TPA: hypothetical protein [Caudoviricetes sp.]
MRKRGILSFSEESIPLYNPREKGRGAFPLDPAALAVLGLKSCATCGIGCGVRGFATSLCESLPISTAPYYREARVTIARRRTTCWRHCCARRRTGAKKRPRQRSFSSMGISPCSCSKAAIRRLIICSSSRFLVRPSYSAIYPSFSSSTGSVRRV